jgi:TIR domain-containing protein
MALPVPLPCYTDNQSAACNWCGGAWELAQPKVFVSHSSKDLAFAERLVKDLRAAGADAWLDIEQLGAGNFQQRISEALEGCEWFVLVLTRAALASQWVRQEVDAANALKHSGQISDLIFFQAGPLQYRELPALWGVFNIFDATADYAAACDRAMKAIGIVVEEPTPPWPALDMGPDSESDRFESSRGEPRWSVELDRGPLWTTEPNSGLGQSVVPKSRSGLPSGRYNRKDAEVSEDSAEFQIGPQHPLEPVPDQPPEIQVNGSWGLDYVRRNLAQSGTSSSGDEYEQEGYELVAAEPRLPPPSSWEPFSPSLPTKPESAPSMLESLTEAWQAIWRRRRGK